MLLSSTSILTTLLLNTFYAHGLPSQTPLLSSSSADSKSPIINIYKAEKPLSEGCPAPKRDSDLNVTRCPDFCAGTRSTNKTSPPLYVCDDERLGPLHLPNELPIAGIQGLDSSYRRFGGLCPGEFLAEYTDSTTGRYVYPPFQGYSLVTAGTRAAFNITLRPGTFLDRFGRETGDYMSAAGTPYAMRSLPPSNLNAEIGAAYPFNYRVYAVTDSIVVEAGPIAGWFGQQGLGLQFKMPKSVGTLVDEGYLTRVNLTAHRHY